MRVIGWLIILAALAYVALWPWPLPLRYRSTTLVFGGGLAACLLIAGVIRIEMRLLQVLQQLLEVRQQLAAIRRDRYLIKKSLDALRSRHG
jgi:hypothetical protein